MNGLDMGTVLVSYVIGSALCAIVIFSLWRANRRQPGVSFWMAYFGLQFAGLLLVVLRGAIPDFLSIVVANLFIVGGALALLMGLERYTDRGSSQRYNYLYLAALMGVQVYFAFVQPSLQARNVNISLGLLVICSQGVWLLLRRVDAATRRDGRPVAYVLTGFTLLSAMRILAELATPVGSTHFQSGLYDTLSILIYQMLHFSLTFALVLMVNRRLQHNLKDELAERAAAEAARRASEAKFRVLADTSPLAIYMSTGIEEKAEYVNATFVRLFGYTMAEVPTAAHWWPRAYPDAPYRQQIVDEWQRKVEQAIATHSEIEPLEVVVTCKDGSHKNILWGFKTIGALNWAFGLDLTERKRAEAALAEAKEAAEAANRAKSQFLANMSHELRTPLNAILGFSELMVRDLALTADQRSNLAIINRSGEYLLSLINDVLDMAKIDAGRLTLQAQDFDLHRLLVDLVELFRARAEARGLTLTLTQGPDVPQFVHGDESKLRQVLLNLLGNAVKFTTVGGVALSVQRSEDRLHFSVQDTGPGIPSEDLTAIFEPFVQVGDGRTMSQGTGLGLSISRELARLMGGELTATSAGIPGQGSRFAFDLPLAPVAGAEEAGPPAPSRRAVGLAPGQPEVRVLVAEDHAESRKLLADLLTGLGFTVRSAENGLEAVAVWEAWRPHLIWMDMRMPVMDGHEATRRIKVAAAGRQTVIVAVSASVLSDERATVLADGCDDFVRKPYRAEEIVAQLVKHLGVAMVYAADAPPVTAMSAAPALALTGLPAAWVEQVRQAATAADAARLLELAAAVASAQPALAAALQAWVDQFDYGAVLTAIAS